MLNPEADFEAEYVTAPAPKVLWIELTSKCPFDCIFCTRRVRFGAGRHLDFEIFRRVIGELDAPDFIGLNYSGESIHYPRLVEAIELAASTGASTEVVTSFSSVSPGVLHAIVASPLDRLAISLHTMNERQYQDIYQFSSLASLKSRVDEFLRLRSELGKTKPRLDFCFVATQGNLDQLGPVVDYARSKGAVSLDIHPIIGRHLIPHDFSRELTGKSLTSSFKDGLRQTIRTVKESNPDFTINVLNPDLELDPRLSHSPGYFSPPLPENASIYSCDQDPFVSVHILANGDVVVCEVLDETPMGNLNQQPLREIWHGPAYKQFRANYVRGLNPECRSCVWKKAYLKGPRKSFIDAADGATPQLLRGWHTADGNDNVLWSMKTALLLLENPQGRKSIRIEGILPPAANREINSMSVRCNHAAAGEIRNSTAEFASVSGKFTLPESWDRVYVELGLSHAYRPSLYAPSADSRDLGFALQRIALED